MDRVVNTTKSLYENPNVNEAPSNQDEDGEEIVSAPGEENPNVNEAPNGDAEEDDSPAVHTVTVTHNGAHTDITARIATATGRQKKRLVIPGHLTAKKLAKFLANVAAW